MKFDISVQAENGHFVAQVLGMPHLRAEGVNNEAATNALLTLLRQKMKQRQLLTVELLPDIEPVVENKSVPKPVFYEFNPKSIRELAGAFKDDPDLMEICEDIYRARDEEKRREFGE